MAVITVMTGAGRLEQHVAAPSKAISSGWDQPFRIRAVSGAK